MADDDGDDDFDADLAKLAAKMQSVSKDIQGWAKAAKAGDESALRELQDIAGSGDIGFLDRAAKHMEQGAEKAEHLRKMWYGDSTMESSIYRYVSTAHSQSESGFVAFSLRREEGGAPFGVCLLVTEAERLLNDLSEQVRIAKTKR
jgi:hypothetical protein